MPHEISRTIAGLILEEKQAETIADRQYRALDAAVRGAVAAGWEPKDHEIDALINGTENERESVLQYIPRPWGDKIDTAIVHATLHTR